ncbi:hypothetical protein H0H93_008735, partial [Arthromyces matolae]
GLDVANVDLVINYDTPTNSKDYVHRVGRTARAGRAGKSILIVSQYDVEVMLRLEMTLERKLELYPTDTEVMALLKERVDEAGRVARNELKEKSMAQSQPSKKKRVHRQTRNEKDRDDDAVEAEFGLNLLQFGWPRLAEMGGPHKPTGIKLAREPPAVGAMCKLIEGAMVGIGDVDGLEINAEIKANFGVASELFEDLEHMGAMSGHEQLVLNQNILELRGTLSLLDATVLKQAPSSAPACLPLVDAVISSAWSTDNTVLFLASSWVIHRYDPASNILRNIYTSSSTDPISHIVCKDKATLILSAGNKVDILECGSTPKITQSLESHKSPITSLSLSNDATLLASTTSNAVHIHNLTLGSHTVLRGIPSSSGGSGITTAVFHPHTRTRLLVGIGKQVLVYDTTRPASSIKSISLNEASSGEIAVVACSPFSKTLVAVATSGGHLGLIDLDKEKGLFRTLNVKVPLTTLGFSPEGAALYLGTEHGKLLVMDLRSLDKAPKAITISEVGCRIETMSVQKKIKGGEINAKPQPSTISTNLTRKSSTQSSRVVSTASPARRVTSTTSKDPIGGTIKATPTRPITTAKKIFSPVRDPLGNSPGDISGM